MFEYTDRQKEVLKLIRNPDYREIYLYGGARSSKTFTFLSGIIMRALEALNNAHCVCRKTIFDQKLNAIKHLDVDSKLLSKTTKNLEGLAFKMKGTTQLRFYNARLSASGNLQFRTAGIFYIKIPNVQIWAIVGVQNGVLVVLTCPDSLPAFLLLHSSMRLFLSYSLFS
jgi:hypothetical protein